MNETGRVELIGVSNKTNLYDSYVVRDLYNDTSLGTIEYCGRSDKYVFHPNAVRVTFDRDSLLIEIADVVRELNGEGD